jgi:hypothetical protein
MQRQHHNEQENNRARRLCKRHKPSPQAILERSHAGRLLHSLPHCHNCTVSPSLRLSL